MINEIKTISNSQLFVISHSEGFIDEVDDEQILFINEKDKSKGLIRPLEKGAKKLVVEDLGKITTPIHEKIKTAYDRQMKSRDEELYKNITLGKFISEIDSTNIQYIMTKQILDDYLSTVHDKIVEIYNVHGDGKLTDKTILDFYIDNLDSLDDFYDFHLKILEKIYGYRIE